MKTRHFIVGTNGGLANTVVYLSRDPNRVFQMSNVTNELVFTDCRLEPAFSVVIRGQPLRVRDNTGVAHVLQGIDDGETEVASGGTVLLATRPTSELPVTISCKIHPWEKSQVAFAFPGIPFTVTDQNGAFSLTNVPPSDYTLVAQHWSGSMQQKASQKLSVRLGRTNSVDLVIQAPAPETAAQF